MDNGMNDERGRYGRIQTSKSGPRNRLTPLIATGPLLLVAASTFGCGATPPSIAVASAALEPSQSAIPTVVSEREILGAVAFRQQYGLRTDVTWVRAVAGNPAAQVGVPEFGYPLMPDEFADLMGRRWDPDLQAQVRRYGLLFPDDFAGAFINQKSSGVIVAFKNDVDRHRVALSNLVPPGSAVDVRKVEWSLADLQAFVEQVKAEEAWFDSIGVIVHVGENGPENTVDAIFRGPEAAAGLIEQHFGNPSWLRARWSGAPPWEGPTADLVIEVVDTDGHLVKNMKCAYEPIDPMVDASGETVFGTGSTGRCVLKNFPAVAYRIGLHELIDDDHDDSIPIKEFQVVLDPKGTTIRVVVPKS